LRQQQCVSVGHFPPFYSIAPVSHVPSQPSVNATYLPYEIDPTMLFQGPPADTFPVIWDSGATRSITAYRSDFVGPITPPSVPLILGGIASGLRVEGLGTVEWSFLSDCGRLLTLPIPAFYVPDCTQRLLSPQTIFSENLQGSFTILSTCCQLQLRDHPILTIAYDPVNSLPTSRGVCSSKILSTQASINLCVTEERNQNLTEAQKEYLRWHFRLGHLHADVIQWILRHPSFRASQKCLAASRCTPPKCAACEYGKAHRRPSHAVTSTPSPEREGAVKFGDLFPGSGVSVDHFESKVLGRLYTSRGRSHDSAMFKGGCLFIDHASGLIYVTHLVGFTAIETISAKHRFEHWAYTHGVLVSKYTTDNGSFGAQEFTHDIQTRGQNVKYCGVGAHHQNGAAERSIRTVSNMARVMMLHASLRWPEAADPALWPMAVDYAAHVYNSAPNPTSGQSPMDIFTRSMVPRHGLKDLHVWGCPCYVLEPKLQNGQKLPRWQPKSRRAVFLGISPNHSSNVPLVLNLKTGNISPQFHVVFDDFFTTVMSVIEGDEPPDNWDHLFHESRFWTYFDEHADVPLSTEWLSADDADRARHLRMSHRVYSQMPLSCETAGSPHISSVPIPVIPEPPVLIPVIPEPTVPIPVLPEPTVPFHVIFEPRNPVLVSPPSIPVLVPPSTPAPPRRSTRSNFGIPADRFLPENHLAPLPYDLQALGYIGSLLTDPDTGYLELNNPLAYVTLSHSDPNSPRYHQAMSGPDSDAFRAAMVAEIDALIAKQTWSLVPRTSIPTKNVLPGTWAFKRKLFPDGRIRKCKARFCVRGDKQIAGLDFFETYAPVVQWSTVRALLVLSCVLDLATQQIDFTNAFCQADIDEELYVEMPQDFGDPQGRDMVLKLRKSLYGTKQAPRTWFLKLKSCLESRGFTQSSLDPCFFIHRDMVYLNYVDDSILIGRDRSKLDSMINDLSSELELTREGDLAAFLGIQISNSDTGSLTFTQAGLIDRILVATNLTNCNPSSTPALKDALGPDSTGPLACESWNYRSIVGMLLYLASNSRPDIAFAVHQCARFSHAPRASHEIALKRICRYLKGTSDKGIIFTPTSDFGLDCYCDSDYAGLFGRENSDDPISAKSRTGYVITLSGCPLIWVSKLQTTIALSTMEAEYQALSQSCRDLIPLRHLIQEAATAFRLSDQFSVRSYSKIYEDNTACLSQASMPKMTPRTKHIAVSYHWFREYVASGALHICKVDTKANLADIFTKGLVRESFTAIRSLLCGW
jgi:Reverse transcriptase (RNA-dependent DNA polymerase)